MCKQQIRRDGVGDGGSDGGSDGVCLVVELLQTDALLWLCFCRLSMLVVVVLQGVDFGECVAKSVIAMMLRAL